MKSGAYKERTCKAFRKHPAYQVGRRDYHAGKAEDECPFPIKDKRRGPWFTGWYDERYRELFGIEP